MYRAVGSGCNGGGGGGLTWIRGLVNMWNQVVFCFLGGCAGKAAVLYITAYLRVVNKRKGQSLAQGRTGAAKNDVSIVE